MGWQDAPLASPTGPKPAWESAPLATQSRAPAGGAVPEDPRDGSYFKGDGLLSRIGNFIHRADEASGRGAQALVGGLERAGQTAANTFGLDSIGDYLGHDAALAEQQANTPVPGATTWEDVKAHPTLPNIGSFIGEQGAAAVPALGAAAVALPAFAVSRLGEVGHERAVNNGGDAASATDLLKSAPTALVDTLLMRYGLKGIGGTSLPAAIGREAVTQGGMAAGDYAGSTLGTDKGFDPAEALDRTAAGVVAGLPLGGTMHLGVRGTRALRELYATKGVDTSAMSDEALTEGSLNGGIHPDVGPDQVNAILQSVGSSPEHFSTPEKAATAAARAKAALPPEAPPQMERELAAVEDTESHGDPNAVSPKGARGSMQTMPGTLRDPGFGVKPAANDSPEEMRRVGRDYYAALRDHYGSAAKAFAAYNAGPGALDGAMHKYGDDWLAHMPEETRNYVRTNIGKIGGEEPVYRGPAPADDPFRSDSGFERTDADQKPTEAELGEKGARYDNMATGDSSQPFKEATDDPEGQPNFWEKRAEMHAEELRKEWESSRQQQQSQTSEDPAGRYGANGYGQRPHMPEGSDAFAMTDEGHIADVNGKPVAFRNIKDAAKFAAKHKLGGDFDPVVWATNSKRVTLRRRDGSTYGERPARPKGPQEPPAGRSEDTSQRRIPEWQKAPVEEAPASEPDLRAEPPESATGPVSGAPDAHLRAERGSEINPNVSHETENVPAGPERFDEAPPAGDDQIYTAGAFNRPRPDADYGGPEPKRPRNFLQAVVKHLDLQSRQSGLRHRVDAEDAINHGVEADAIYINPRAKYPAVKAHLHRIFSSSKAPLRSKAQPVKLHSLDYLGDRFSPDDFGVPGDELHGHRIDPEHAAQLLNDSIYEHESAFDRSDPLYEKYSKWVERYNSAQEFEARYGDRWHEIPDEELDRIDAENSTVDDLLDDVLGEHDYGAPPRPFADQASDGEAAAESPRGDDERPEQPREEGGRGASAEDAQEPEPRPVRRSGTHNPGDYTDRQIDELPNQTKNWRGVPDAEVETAKGPDGYHFSTGYNHSEGGMATPFGHSPAFKTREEARAAGFRYLQERGPKTSGGARGDRIRKWIADNAGNELFGGERATDTRDHLQRKADEGLKPGKEQKPAGSDGGLFDTRDTTGNLLKDLWNNEEGSLNLDKLAGMFIESDANPGEIVDKVRDLVRSPVKTTKGALKALDRFGSAVAYSSDGALRTLARHYNSPTIAKLADMFQARAGAPDATGRTYDEALKRSNGRFRSRLDKALDPFMGDKAAMERIRDLLADPDRSVRSTVKERAAAKEVRDLLDDVIAYRKEAGEDIGEVKNYFPRVLDSLAVANNPAKFKAAAERLYRDLGVEDSAAAAEAWMVRVLDTHAGLDGGEEFLQNSGKPSSSKGREFGAQADRELRDFLQKDPLLVLSDYVTGSVRRAEQTRRFGAKGTENSPERAEWMKEHGTKTQWDVMLDDIRAELRKSGEDADGIVRQVKMIRDGAMGRLGTAGVRLSRAVSTIHAWNQLSTLQRVTLSSMGDLAMGFVRGGPTYGVRHFATSLKEAARLVEAFGKRDLSDGHRWAEAMGTVGHGTASQLIQARMDAAPGAVQHAALLNKFYHKVGIEQLTQGGRVAATENAKIFLDTLAHDLLSGSARTRQRATLYLKELGIKEPQAFGERLRKGAPSDEELAADKGHAAEYATAVVRFADQSVLMPSRAQKPAWANHPVGSLLFALQSYNAAFTQNVLKRTGRLAIEGVKSKDPALLIPASGLVVLAGMNALQIYLRQKLFGGKEQDDATQFALQVLDRTGLTGMASPFYNALYGTKYHRSISQSLQGSVLGRVSQAADAAAGLVTENSKKTNSAERKAAGLLYDLAIDPAANAFGAKYVKGAAGTALIMGTGNKAGGALPGDRDAFIEAVAGKEKKRVSSGE